MTRTGDRITLGMYSLTIITLILIITCFLGQCAICNCGNVVTTSNEDTIGHTPIGKLTEDNKKAILDEVQRSIQDLGRVMSNVRVSKNRNDPDYIKKYDDLFLPNAIIESIDDCSKTVKTPHTPKEYYFNRLLKGEEKQIAFEFPEDSSKLQISEKQNVYNSNIFVNQIYNRGAIYRDKTGKTIYYTFELENGAIKNGTFKIVKIIAHDCHIISKPTLEIIPFA